MFVKSKVLIKYTQQFKLWDNLIKINGTGQGGCFAFPTNNAAIEVALTTKLSRVTVVTQWAKVKRQVYTAMLRIRVPPSYWDSVLLKQEMFFGVQIKKIKHTQLC